MERYSGVDIDGVPVLEEEEDVSLLPDVARSKEFIEDDEYVCFINKMGKDIDGFYIYEFLFCTKDELEVVWGQDWNYKPAGICGDIPPEEGTYSSVKVLKTDLLLDVAQESMCHSMQDCINGVIALGYENLDDPEKEYPEEGVLVFHFGEHIKSVEEKLARRGLIKGWK